MNSWVWDQVGLELSNINVQGTIEPQRSSQGRDDLRDETVEVGVSGPLNAEGTSADVVDSFIVEEDRDISVLQERVSGEDTVVRLNDRGRDLWRWVNSETELGLFPVVDRKSLKEKRSKTRSSSSTNSVEDKESLETGTVISELSDTVQAQINNFLPNGVMSTGEVVSCVFFTADELFRVEKLTVSTGPDLIDHSGLKVDEDGTWDVLPCTGLTEEGVESIVSSANSLVTRHLAIRLNAMFEAV